VAEHNTMDHLTELIKSLDPSSEILKNLHMHRTKTTAVMKHVIGKCHKEYLDCLKNTKFSILTDESTDISCIKQACIVVRYFNQDMSRIVSHFFELSNIFETNDYKKAQEGATGKNVYGCIFKSFAENNIPFENVIGFGSDVCNSMMLYDDPQFCC